MDILSEDNQNIESLIKHLDNLIIKLRKENKFKQHPEIFRYLEITYNDYVLYFYENYLLLNKEIDKNSEQTIINELLDVINVLKQIK